MLGVGDGTGFGNGGPKDGVAGISPRARLEDRVEAKLRHTDNRVQFTSYLMLSHPVPRTSQTGPSLDAGMGSAQHLPAWNGPCPRVPGGHSQGPWWELTQGNLKAPTFIPIYHILVESLARHGPCKSKGKSGPWE